MTGARAVSAARLELRHLWLALPVFAVVLKGFLFPLPLLDFWWHLKLGEIIATERSLPRTDIFSFTAAGQPFIVQGWLAELIYYATYRAGGLPLIILLNTMLLVGALLPVYQLCRETGASTRVSAFAAWIAALGLFANTRPQVFSFPLFALFFWVLWRYRVGRRDLLWLLPPLMVLWVNLHGAFVLGLGLVALFAVSEAVHRAWLPSAAALSSAQLRKLSVVAALCGAATLVNPELHRVYSYVHSVMADPSSQQLVVEWQPPRIDSLAGVLLFYGPLFFTILVLIHSERKPDLTEIAILLTFAVLGLKSTRNTVWFDLVVPVLAARYLPSVTWRLGPAPFASLLRHGSKGRPGGSPRMNLLVAAMALGVVVLTSPWVYPRVYGTSLLESGTPIGAMDFIAEKRLTGNIFHPQAYGDYLIWRLWPQQRSFFDGRVHVFGAPLVRYYRQVFLDSHWEEMLAKYDIRYLLLDKRSDGDTARIIGDARRSTRWRLLYEDDLSVLFERVAR